MKKSYYSVRDLAEHFSISIKSVYRLIDEERLKSVKIRNILRISASEVERYEKKIKKNSRK